MFGRDAEAGAKQAARAGGCHRPRFFVGHRGQAARDAHLVNGIAQIGRGVGKGAVKVEQDGPDHRVACRM